MDVITVQELKEMRDQESDFTLLDVRNDDEVEIASIKPSMHIPLHELEARIDELDKKREIVVMCQRGGRSAKATRYLSGLGFNAKNLEGGIDAWSREIDPSVPQY